MDIVSKCLVVLLIAHNVDHVLSFNTQLPTKEIVVQRGSNITLSCAVDYTTFCLWAHHSIVIIIPNHSRISSKYPYSLKDYTIEIQMALPKDEGIWECHCQIGIGLFPVLISMIRLKVTPSLQMSGMSPEDVFETQPQNTTVTLGENFNLECSLKIMASCKWRHNGIPLPMMENPPNDFSYQVFNASKDHEGIWQCVCTFNDTNSSEMESNEAWVTITSPTHNNTGISTVTITSGQTFFLYCHFKNISICSWTRNKERIWIYREARMTFSNSEFSDWSIIVTDANEDDHGQWECACHETSPFTSIRHNKTVVTVLYQKGIDIFHNQPQNLTVDLGETFFLDCTLKRRTVCQWRHNGTLIQEPKDESADHSQVELRAAKNHEGRWQCVCSSNRTSSNLDIDSNEAWVTVRIPEKTNIASASTTVIAGQEFIVYCKFRDSGPCFWTHNDQKVYTFEHRRLTYVNVLSSDWSIRVRNAEKQDEGEWECTCHSDDFSTVMEHNKTVVTVLLPGADLFQRQPQNVTVTLGESFSLACTFTSIDYCIWKHNDAFNQFGYGPNDFTLNVANASESHEGRWQCVCHREPPLSLIVSNEAWVTVITPDENQSEMQPSNATIRAGDDFILNCTFANPLYCLWEHNGTFVIPSSHGRITFRTSSGWSLYIHEAEQRDQGQWECSCTVNNSPFQVYNTILVTVLTTEADDSSQLTLLENPENVIVTEGQSFSLTAIFNQKVYCAWQHFRYPWLNIRNDTSLSTRNCTLIIEKARPMDEGAWIAIGVQLTGSRAKKQSYPVDVTVVKPIPVNVMELNETTSPSTNHVSSNEDVPFQLDTLSSSPNTVSPNRTVSLTTDVSSIQPTVTTINCTSWDVPTDSTYEKQMLFHHPEGNYSTTNSFLISLICILGLTTVGLVIFLYMKRGLLFDARRKDRASYEVRLVNADSEVSIETHNTGAN